ncbi:MAG: matrixin family metalloprotease [Cyanobacteriota bacterium]
MQSNLSQADEEIINLNNKNFFTKKYIQKKINSLIKSSNCNDALSLYENNKVKDIDLKINISFCFYKKGDLNKSKLELKKAYLSTQDFKLRKIILEYMQKIESSKIEDIKPINISNKNASFISLDSINNSYLCSEKTSVRTSGILKRWNKNEIPLKVYIGNFSSDIPLYQAPFNEEQYRDFIREAFKKWVDKFPEKLAFNMVASKEDANILVNLKIQFSNFNFWGLTSQPKYFDNINKKLSFINIPIRTHGIISASSNFRPTYFNKNEFISLALHEIGHSLGLPDNNNNNSLMNKSIHFLSIFDTKREIDKIDIDNFNILYNLNEENLYRCATSFFQENYSDDKLYDMRNDKNTYLCFTQGNPELYSDGKSYIKNYMRWEHSDFPLKVFIPIPDKKIVNVNNPEHYVNLVKNSIEKWQRSVPELLSFVFVDNDKSANIVIDWSDYFKHNDYWGATYSYPDSKIKNKKGKAIIKLAVKSQANWMSNKPIIFDDETFSNISLHEMSHAIGLDHGNEMEGATGLGAIIDKRDIDSIKKLYSIPIDYSLICPL